MNNKKKLKLAATIDGVGWNYVGWQHPECVEKKYPFLNPIRTL